MYWRKPNSVKSIHVSVYPSDAWKITKVAGGWELAHAPNDGDKYEPIQDEPFKTLALAKEAAENWTPTQEKS